MLERLRLRQVLGEWLVVEAGRSPFRVVGFEERLVPNFKGLSFSTRADRIDRQPDGSTVILDYKTGLVSKKSWDGDRPDR